MKPGHNSNIKFENESINQKIKTGPLTGEAKPEKINDDDDTLEYLIKNNLISFEK
jgi:hypothetical protein